MIYNGDCPHCNRDLIFKGKFNQEFKCENCGLDGKFGKDFFEWNQQTLDELEKER